MLLEWWAEGSREMRPLLASSLLLLATVGAACERGEHADPHERRVVAGEHQVEREADGVRPAGVRAVGGSYA